MCLTFTEAVQSSQERHQERKNPPNTTTSAHTSPDLLVLRGFPLVPPPSDRYNRPGGVQDALFLRFISSTHDLCDRLFDIITSPREERSPPVNLVKYIFWGDDCQEQNWLYSLSTTISRKAAIVDKLFYRKECLPHESFLKSENHNKFPISVQSSSVANIPLHYSYIPDLLFFLLAVFERYVYIDIP